MVAWRVELDALCAMVAGVASGDSGDGGGALGRLATGTAGMDEAGVKDATTRACRVANDIAAALAACDDDARKRELADDRARVTRVLSALYYIDQALSASSAAWRSVVAVGAPGAGAGDAGGELDLAAGIARFAILDTETEMNHVQQLLMFLLNTAQVKGYRRRHGDMYRRLRAPDGGAHDTHAWERVCDMRDFVYESTRKEVHFDMWMNLTRVRTNVQAVVDYLSTCHDVQLPDLHPDRHVFSFTNGVYLAHRDEFVAYGTPAHAALPTDLVAAKYFDQPFPAELASHDDDDDWYAIPTPHVQGILDYQDMGEDVCRWMYVMLGRMLYDVGERDAWQVIPFLKGAASSGKSTLLVHVCRNFYQHDDVGTLSNNIERKFGLSALHDKLLFIGPEIKADIQLEQAEFQSVVSGETVQVATKFRTAQSVQWRVPGALAGNEVPGWVDKAGSINRRIVLFDFPKRVHDGDMELGKKIERSLPSLLVKCNRAYLQAVERHARDNIWKHLPAPFHAAKEALSESCNSIVHFLRSGLLEFGTKCYMPFPAFAAAYESYVHDMGLTRLKLSGDNVGQPLLNAACRVVKSQSLRYPRAVDAAAGAKVGQWQPRATIVNGPFIMGCDLIATTTHAAPDDADPDPQF
jgi:hypothetical protein